MADNTTLNAGSLGDVIATDDLATLNGGASGTVKVQRVKMGYGADSDLNDVSIAQPAPVSEIPTSTASYAPSKSKSSAYETNRVAKASAGTLYSIIGYNAKTTAQFIQLHNTTSLPADTTAPDLFWSVPALSNFSLSSDKFGLFCDTGITICNSSTGPTKTIGSADCWFYVLYK